MDDNEVRLPNVRNGNGAETGSTLHPGAERGNGEREHFKFEGRERKQFTFEVVGQRMSDLGIGTVRSAEGWRGVAYRIGENSSRVNALQNM